MKFILFLKVVVKEDKMPQNKNNNLYLIIANRTSPLAETPLDEDFFEGEISKTLDVYVGTDSIKRDEVFGPERIYVPCAVEYLAFEGKWGELFCRRGNEQVMYTPSFDQVVHISSKIKNKFLFWKKYSIWTNDTIELPRGTIQDVRISDDNSRMTIPLGTEFLYLSRKPEWTIARDKYKR